MGRRLAEVGEKGHLDSLTVRLRRQAIVQVQVPHHERKQLPAQRREHQHPERDPPGARRVPSSQRGPGLTHASAHVRRMRRRLLFIRKASCRARSRSSTTSSDGHRRPSAGHAMGVSGRAGPSARSLRHRARGPSLCKLVAAPRSPYSPTSLAATGERWPRPLRSWRSRMYSTSSSVPGSCS